MKIRLSKITVLLSCLLVGACTHNPQPMGKPLPQLTYEHLNAYRPYGGGVEVRQSFQPDAQAAKTIREFPVAPDELLQRYASQRFDQYERPIKMLFDIQKASITKKSDAENLVGFLSGASENSYLLDIYIMMSPVRANGALSKPFTISLQRTLNLPQRLSLAEKEFRQFEFLEQAMNDVDHVVTEFVTQKMR